MMETLATEKYPKVGSKIPESRYPHLDGIISDIKDYSEEVSFDSLSDGFDTLYDLGEWGDHEMKVAFEITQSNSIEGFRCTTLSFLKITGFRLTKNGNQIMLSEADTKEIMNTLQWAYPETNESELIADMDDEGEYNWYNA